MKKRPQGTSQQETKFVYAVVIRNRYNSSEVVDSIFGSIEKAKERIAELVSHTEARYVFHIEEHQIS